MDQNYWWHLRHIMNHAVSSNNGNSFFTGIVGPIIGALVAGIVGLFTEWVRERRNRYSKHKDALVRLETLLNEHLDQISIYRTIIDNARDVLEKHHFTSRRFLPFILDPSIRTDLATLDFINSYFSYTRYITRLNTDFDSFNRTLDQMELAAVNGQPLPKENFDALLSGLSDLSQETHNHDQQAIRLLVRVRIYLAKAKLLNKFWYPLMTKDWRLPITQDEIERETERLKGEMASAGSRQEI